jgi:hypothetical protein
MFYEIIYSEFGNSTVKRIRNMTGCYALFKNALFFYHTYTHTEFSSAKVQLNCFIAYAMRIQKYRKLTVESYVLYS